MASLQTAQNHPIPADIIIAVDNSGSMREEIAFVRDQLNTFSQFIVASGVDVRIILISARRGPPSDSDDDDDDDGEDDDDEDNGLCIAPPLGSGSCPEDTRLPRYFHVPHDVGSHDALELFIDLFGSYRDQLRPEASKHFVVISDDDAKETAARFTQQVAALPGGLFSSWRLSGIYCFSQCAQAASIGAIYQQLVGSTGGAAGDLCLQNFGPVFVDLARQVVDSSRLDCAWDIPGLAGGVGFDRDRVDVQYGATTLAKVEGPGTCGPSQGWHYDDFLMPRRIVACPATCALLQADPRARLEVSFGCDTQTAPD